MGKYEVNWCRADFYGEGGIVMQDKVYVVNYYMYDMEGIHAIFTNKEDAEACAKIMTEYDDYTSECIFDVSEEVVYSSLDESMKYLEIDFQEE